MKKVLILAGMSAFVLIGAAYPDAPAPRLAYGAAVMAGTTDVTATYRPCRRDRRDDRCIQLYERGVRQSYASWLREHAMGGPDTDRAEAPRRERHARGYRDDRRAHRPDRGSYALTDTRCLEPAAHQPRRHDDARGERRSYDDRRYDDRRRDDDRGHGGYDGEVRGM